MEGVIFLETPEQAKERQLQNISWKQRNGCALSASDYDLLQERQTDAISDLASKFFN